MLETTVDEHSARLLNDEPKKQQVERVPWNFAPTYMDTILASIITFAIPVCFKVLYAALEGATLPLVIYYLLLCLIIPQWRRCKGSGLKFNFFDYRFPKMERKALMQFWLFLFLPFFVIECAKIYIVFQIVLIEDGSSDTSTHYFLTLLVWCPFNSFCEQLCWMYILDSFWNRAYMPAVLNAEQTQHIQHSQHTDQNWCMFWSRYPWIHKVIGFAMCLVFVATIHVFFWTQFLMEFDESAKGLYSVFFAAKIASIVEYIVLWKKSHSMIPLFMLHIMSDMSSAIAAKYSIVSSLKS